MFGSRAKAIDLADGENVENQEIALKRGAVITGRVTDASGKPLVEQRVELTRLDERGQPARGAPGFSPYANLTDDRGIYRIYGLQAGRYLVGGRFRAARRFDYGDGQSHLLSTHIPSRHDRTVEGQGD